MTSIEQLDLSPLAKAISSIEEAILAHQMQPADKFIRDACIQRFEYSYELCHKFLRRYLTLSEASAEVVKEMSFPELIRTASIRSLVQNNWETWQMYRDARNMTSHTYDEPMANKVLSIIPDFLQDAKYLLAALQKHIQPTD